MADFWEEYRNNQGDTSSVDVGGDFWDAYNANLASRQAEPEAMGGYSFSPSKADDPNSIGSTLGRATDQLQASFGGTAEAFGEFFGSDFLREYGKAVREQNIAEAAEYGNPENATWSDVNGVEDVPEYLKQLGLSTVPALGTTVAGAYAGARAGAAAGPVGATIGGAVGGILASLGINVGDVQNRIKQENPELDASGTAIGAGTAMSALDAVGAGVLLRPLIKRMGAETVYSELVKQGVTKQAAASAIAGAVTEGVTEVGQEAIAEAGTSQAIGRAFDTEQFLNNAIDSLIGGGLVGSITGGSTGAMSAIQNNQLVSDGVTDPGAVGGVQSTDRVGALKSTLYAIANRPTSFIEPLGNVSETAKDFLDTFRRDTSLTTEASKPTLKDSQELMAGKWRTNVREALRRFDNDTLQALVTDPSTNQDAQVIRDTLENVIEEARKADLNVGHIQNYLPVDLDVDLLQDPNTLNQFVAEIAPYMTDSKGKPQSLDAVKEKVNEWIATVTNPERDTATVAIEKKYLDPQTLEAAKKHRVKDKPDSLRSKLFQGTIPPEFGQLEKNRTFAKVPQDILLKYSPQRDNPQAVAKAINDYLEGAAHRIVFAQNFGPRGEKANYNIAKIIHEANAKGRAVGLDEVQRMYDLLDAYNNMHGRIKSQNVKNFQSLVGAGVTATVLPLVLFSSVVESVVPAIRGEIGAAVRAIGPTLRYAVHSSMRAAFKNVPPSEMSLQISQANLSLAAADNVMAARVNQSLFNTNASTFMKYFFRATGLTYWTQATRVYAAHVAKDIIDRNISELAAGVPVDSPRGRYLRTQLAEMGIEINSEADARAVNAPSTMTERQKANDLKVLGIRRFVNESVLEPGFEDKPLWESNGKLQLLAHLKGYPTMFTNTVLPQVVRRFDPRRVGGAEASTAFLGSVFLLGLMLSLGYAQDWIKQVIKHGDLNYDERRTEEQVLLDVINQTFAPIHASLLMDIIAAPRYGTSGLLAPLGPTAGKIESTAKTISQFLEKPEEGKIWRYLYKEATPIGFFRPGREAAENIDLF
jgi:hypothetical protein